MRCCWLRFLQYQSPKVPSLWIRRRWHWKSVRQHCLHIRRISISAPVDRRIKYVRLKSASVYPRNNRRVRTPVQLAVSSIIATGNSIDTLGRK